MRFCFFLLRFFCYGKFITRTTRARYSFWVLRKLTSRGGALNIMHMQRNVNKPEKKNTQTAPHLRLPCLCYMHVTTPKHPPSTLVSAIRRLLAPSDADPGTLWSLICLQSDSLRTRQKNTNKVCATRTVDTFSCMPMHHPYLMQKGMDCTPVLFVWVLA